jgi:hypothetical protein
MPLSEEQIEPGKCYKTKAKENYRVLSIERGIVTYQTFDSPLRINVGVKAFADAVYKVIACPEKK